MTKLRETCRLCARLPGCEHLPVDPQRNLELDWDRIIDEDSEVTCPSWQPMGDRETLTREKMCERFGESYLNAVYLIPRRSLEDIQQEDYDMIEVPDFAGMCKPGTTLEQRREQFLYETDEEGQIAVDNDGEKIPRGELPLRKYAKDPDGPLGSPDCETAVFWDFDKLLTAVLKKEARDGLIIGPPKKRRKKAAEPPKTEEKEEKMGTPVKPRMMLRRGKGAPAKKEKETKDKTPTKARGGKVGKAATSKKRAAKSDNGEAKDTGTAVQAIDMGAIKEIVTAAVGEAVAPLAERVEAVEAAVQGLGGRSLAQTVVDSTTVLHDILLRKINEDLIGPEDEDEDEEAMEERVTAQCLYSGSEDPVDILSFYMDSAGE